jgi:hypothetical protein
MHMIVSIRFPRNGSVRYRSRVLRAHHDDGHDRLPFPNDSAAVAEPSLVAIGQCRRILRPQYSKEATPAIPWAKAGLSRGLSDLMKEGRGVGRSGVTSGAAI